MIATSALASVPSGSDDYATKLFRAKGLAQPGLYANQRQEPRVTIALFKSGEGIGKPMVRQENKHHSPAVAQSTVGTAKGLSKPGAQ